MGFSAFFVIFILWVFFLSPYLTFRSNETKFTKAGKKYFETNTRELPTGERVAEVSLQKLYESGYVGEDYYIPYTLFTKKTCNVTDSWVKVKKVNGEYKYYTYLKCGILSSTIDHKGPKIKLNDKEEMVVALDEEFKDPGVKSVRDNQDGKIDTKEVVVKGSVDTTKIGTYKLSYIVFDSMKNRTEVTRTVKVVQMLKNTIKKATKTGVYTGGKPKNYIYFSGMVFRIVDLDGNNVRIVAEKDIANVNHDGIEDWLKYYYDHITKESKKYIVKNKYCQMTLKASDTNTTECSSYTKKREVFIPSIVDVNKASEDIFDNYMKTKTMSWLADKESASKSYLTRDIFYNDALGQNFLSFDDKYNFGVRPMLTIKGDIMIQGGDGSKNNPYNIGDFEYAKPDDKVSSRQSGEYVLIDSTLWRITDGQQDGTTKVIYEESLHQFADYLIVNYGEEKDQLYNPKNKDNIGYKINNLSSKYIPMKYFVKHEIEVPVYKKDAKYGQEIKVNKYQAKVAAPNMYEMFTAASLAHFGRSYWTINSSQNANLKYGVSDIGVVMYGEMSPYITFGVRPVAFLHKDCVIVSGKGTASDPYKIDK
ncbi:MAG: DUF5011 domain-containing protein [Bacilli bacterium]|nr:DUF5011 domain-containing protein [Bacilli bacterium]